MANLKILKRFMDEIHLISPNIFVKTYLLIDYFLALIIHGASPHDFTLCQMYRKSFYERFSFLTMRRAKRIESWFNDSKYVSVFNDKVVFNDRFKEFVKRDWLLSSASNSEEIFKLISSHDSIIIKPINSSSGKGIKKIKTKDISDINSFIKKCLREQVLLEECIEQSALFKSLNPYSVNTIRMYTVIDQKGKPHIIAAGLRAGTTKSPVDNMHDNGIYYPLDPERGIIVQHGMNINGDRFLYHPNTNIRMIGLQLPDYNKICHFVTKATSVYPQCRFIGWDIAVTEEGYEMIEGNVFPYIGDLQVYDNKGYYPIFKQFK